MSQTTRWIERNEGALINSFYDSCEYQELFTELQDAFNNHVIEKCGAQNLATTDLEILIMDDLSISDIED